MIVSVERRGGFAGLRRTLRVDSAALPAPEGARLLRAVRSARLLSLRSQAPGAAAAQPDRFSYRITVEDGARRHSVTVDEECGGALLALIALVEELAG